MKIINCYNLYHLGDCIETLHFLINATKCNDIHFNFYCNQQYHTQLQEFISKYDNICLVKEFTNTEDPINTWIGAYDYAQICRESDVLYGINSDQGTFFLMLSQILSRKMDIICPFSSKDDMIYNQEVLQEVCSHNESYDYLFVNSQNMSIHFPMFERECEILVEKLKLKKKKFITTRKILDIPCTVDYNLSVVEIAKLSKNITNIIAVNTGPLHLCMNKWTIPLVEKFIIWSPAETFNYSSKFQTVRSLGEINENSL